MISKKEYFDSLPEDYDEVHGTRGVWEGKTILAGTHFVVTVPYANNSSQLPQGTIVRCKRDDGSCCPYFFTDAARDRDGDYIYLEELLLVPEDLL